MYIYIIYTVFQTGKTTLACKSHEYQKLAAQVWLASDSLSAVSSIQTFVTT